MELMEKCPNKFSLEEGRGKKNQASMTPIFVSNTHSLQIFKWVNPPNFSWFQQKRTINGENMYLVHPETNWWLN